MNASATVGTSIQSPAWVRNARPGTSLGASSVRKLVSVCGAMPNSSSGARIERLAVGADAGIAEPAVFGVSSGHILRQLQLIDRWGNPVPLRDRLPKRPTLSLAGADDVARRDSFACPFRSYCRHKNLPRWEHVDLCHDPTLGAYVGEQVIIRYDSRDVRKSGHIICGVTAIPLRARGLDRTPVRIGLPREDSGIHARRCRRR